MKVLGMKILGVDKNCRALTNITLALFLVSSLMFAACGSSSGSSSSASSLVGTWKLQSNKDNATATAQDLSASNITLTFAANGNATLNMPAGARGTGTSACSESGSYSATATSTTFNPTADTCHTPSEAGTAKTSSYTISGTTLTMNNSDGSIGTWSSTTMASPVAGI